MGGRGGSSGLGKKGASLIGNAAPIKLENQKSKSGFNRWRQDIFEAKEVKEEKGHLSIGYATPVRYSNPNKNTTEAEYNLKAGIYNQMGDRSFHDHNINWDKVNKVSGQTYGIKDMLISKGFKWNPDDKTYIKPKK